MEDIWNIQSRQKYDPPATKPPPKFKGQQRPRERPSLEHQEQGMKLWNLSGVGHSRSTVEEKASPLNYTTTLDLLPAVQRQSNGFSTNVQAASPLGGRQPCPSVRTASASITWIHNSQAELSGSAYCCICSVCIQLKWSGHMQKATQFNVDKHLTGMSRQRSQFVRFSDHKLSGR